MTVFYTTETCCLRVSECAQVCVLHLPQHIHRVALLKETFHSRKVSLHIIVFTTETFSV